MLDEKYVIRFCVNAPNASDDDMLRAWELIKTAADSICDTATMPIPAVPLTPPTPPALSPQGLLSCQVSQDTSIPTFTAGTLANTSSNDSSVDNTHEKELSTKMKRLRFGISKMVSEPEFIGTKYQTSPKNQYKRTNTFRFNTRSMSGADKRKYLARKCSMIEKEEDEEQE